MWRFVRVEKCLILLTATLRSWLMSPLEERWTCRCPSLLGIFRTRKLFKLSTTKMASSTISLLTGLLSIPTCPATQERNTFLINLSSRIKKSQWECMSFFNSWGKETSIIFFSLTPFHQRNFPLNSSLCTYFKQVNRRFLLTVKTHWTKTVSDTTRQSNTELRWLTEWWSYLRYKRRPSGEVSSEHHDFNWDRTLQSRVTKLFSLQPIVEIRKHSVTICHQHWAGSILSLDWLILSQNQMRKLLDCFAMKAESRVVSRSFYLSNSVRAGQPLHLSVDNYNKT